MKPVIKYLLNGEYHYATVKDIGDIDKLKTSVKTDLVGAINSVIGETGGGVIPDDLQERLDQIDQNITDIANSGLNEKQLEELQEKIATITEEVDSRIKALESTYNEKLDTVTSEYDKKVADINSDLANVKTNITSTEDILEKVGKDLSSVELNVTKVTSTVDEINGELKNKIDSTEFDLLESTVSDNTTSITQNKKDIGAKASKQDLDLATGRIADAEASIKLNSEGITSAVKRDELRKELDNNGVYGANLLRDTRDWQSWEANTPSRAYVIGETYNHLHIQEQLGSGNYLESTLSNLEVGKTYTASVWAKSTSSKAKAILRADSKQYGMINHNKDEFLSNSWERVSISFVAENTESTISFTANGVENSATTHFAGAKIEIGTTFTGWQANEEDVYERVVSTESTIKQHSDQITSMVEEQVKIGEDVTSQKTEINQMSDKIGLHAEKLEEIDGEVSSQKASIELNSNNIKSKVEQTDVDKTIEGVSLDSRNLVLNSDFFLDMDSWSNINENFKLNKVDGKNHLKISRTGLTNNVVASASSNMFSAKSGDKLSIGLDVTVDKLSQLDIKTIIVLELFDIKDTRVSYKEFTIDELDGKLVDGKTGRLTTRYVIDREDVDKARLRLTLYRNGSISFTNITIEKGDIKSVGWNPAPEDSQLVQADMQTSIDQNAKDITLRAKSSTVDKISGKLDSNEADLKVANDKITANVNKLTNVDGTLKEHNSQIQQNAKEIKSKVTSTEVDELLGKKKYATQSELSQKANEISANVSSVSDSVTDITLNDKTDILSGTEIYTDKADNDSVVHVEVDGKSVLQAPVGEGRNLFKEDSVRTWADASNAIGSSGNWKSFYVKAEPSTVYSLSRTSMSNSRFRIYFLKDEPKIGMSLLDSGYGSFDNDLKVENFKTEEDTNWIFVYLDNAGNNLPNIKLEKGSTATPYSPAPEDVENNIQSVNNFDIISQKTTVNIESAVDGIEVGGRNLLLNSKIEIGSIIESKPAGSKYEEVIFNSPTRFRSSVLIFIGGKFTSNVKKDFKYAYMKFDENKEYIGRSNGGFSGFKTGVYTDEAIYILPVLAYEDNRNMKTEDVINSELKIERGTKATDWTPAPEDNPYDTLENNLYKTNILLSEPLRSVGDVKDRLFRDSDSLWKVERNVGERTLDGSESWVMANNSTYSDTVSRFNLMGSIDAKDSPSDTHTPLIISNMFNPGQLNFSIRTKNGITQDLFGKNIYVFTDKASSLSEFKAFLSNSNLEIIYEKANQTIETLDQELQDKLNNLRSFQGSNYVYTVINDKSEILSKELAPTLHAKFKSKGWYRNFTIDVSSKDSTQQTINQLKANKARVDAQYKEVYDNYSLSSTLKNNLSNAKTAYNTKYSQLILALDVILNVNSGANPTKSQKDNVNKAFNEYTSALQTFESRYQEALTTVEKRISNAELKIEDDAITSTVTSSTEFKNVKNTADTAKSTANNAKSTADTLKNTTLPQLASRVNTAEQKITDKAIVSTVTQSSTYKNEMTGKVSTDKVISSINQTAEKVTIDAKKINLNGAVTISSFGSGLKSDFDKAKTDASSANTKATSAQSTANTAKSTADSASTKATTATSTANTAKTTADGAKSTANSANTKATNATNRVAKVETNINNAVTTIDGTGVTVKDGSFFLEDDQSDTKYSIISKSNLLKDHSFELVDIQYSGNIPKFDTHGNQYFKANPDPILLWKTTGSPRLHSGIGSSITHQGLFGMNTAIVNSTNHVSQAGIIFKSGKHTVSGFFAPATGMSSTATPRIEVSVIESTSENAFKTIRTWSKNFTAVTTSKGMVRYSLTVDVPAGDLSGGWAYLQVTFKTTNASWVYADGAQLVEGDSPVFYESETGLFDFMNGIKGSHAKDIRIDGGNRGGPLSAVYFTDYEVW